MGEPTWGFLTNHFYVLRSIAQEPSLTLREVADRIGITERAVQRIVSELEEAGYLLRERAGRGPSHARAARNRALAGRPELTGHLVCACAPPGSGRGIDAAQAASAALRCPISVTMRAGSTETTTRFAAERTPGGTGMSLRRGR